MYILKTIIASIALISAGVSQAASAETPETLHQAVQDALRYYPSIKKANADQQRAEALLSQAKGEFYPAVDLRYATGRQNYSSPDTFVDGALSGTLGTAKLHPIEKGLVVTQPIFSGLSSVYLVKQRRSEMDSARYQVMTEKENIAMRAASAYLQTLQANELVALGQENTALHKKISNLIKIQYKGGYGHKADVDLANAHLALAESTLTTLEGQKQNAIIAYTQIVGHPPSQKLLLPTSPHYCDGCDITALRERALQLNPALQSAISNVDAASSVVDTANANFYPKVAVTYSNNQNDDISGVAGAVRDQKVMLSVTYNAFSGGADSAKKRQAVWQRTSAKEDRKKTELTVLHDLTEAWNNFNISKSQVKEYKAYVESMLLTAKGYHAQFKIGARSLFDVLTVENELYQARQNYVAARYNVLFYHYQMLALIGVLSGSIATA